MVSSPWLVPEQPWPQILFLFSVPELECLSALECHLPTQLPAHLGSTSFPPPHVYFPFVSTVCLALLQPSAVFLPVYRTNMTLKQLTSYISLQGFKWWPLPFPSSRVTSSKGFSGSSSLPLLLWAFRVPTHHLLLVVETSTLQVSHPY